MAEEIKKLFMEARKIYNQSGETRQFYTSTKNIKGLFFTVLPDYVNYKFSSYDPGNKKDVEKVRNMKKEGIHKSYLCSLCPLGHDDTSVTCSEEQNQLWDDNKSPSKLINKSYDGESGRKYRLTGTIPQYFYSHLMFISEDHIPTYGIFFDEYLFTDTMNFLQKTKVVGYHNGNFGSDIYHFHLHITDQKNSILDDFFIGSIEENTKIGFSLIKPIIKACTVIDTKISDLFNNVRGIMFRILDKQEKDLVISSSFFVRENKGKTYYCVVLNFVNRKYRNFKYDNCNYFVFPASYTLSVGCMNIPKNSTENYKFLTTLENHYVNYYIDPKIIFKQYGLTGSLENFVKSSDNQINKKLQILEKLATKHNTLKKFIEETCIENIYLYLLEYEQNFELKKAYDMLKFINKNYKDKLEEGRIKYLLSLCINSLTKEELKNYFDSDDFIDMRLNASNMILSNYGELKSDYLFFKGKFVQDLISSNISNRIEITNSSRGQKYSVNKWLKYDFKRKGEASANGTVTTSKLQDNNIDIDFIMKLMITEDEDKHLEFKHELNTSMIVNELRYLVPNYILCYGGYECNSSSFKQLCNGIGRRTSYILLEYVENSDTVDRVLKTPRLDHSTEEKEIIDMISQILMGLAFGYNEKKFTHYDLHTNNIMCYDFVNNNGFLKLFKSQGDRNSHPNVENVIFRYYINKEGRYLDLPATYLYLIIDYGNSYVEGIDPENVREGLFGSDKPNKSSDCYTLLYNVFTTLLIHKPYLLIDQYNYTWLNNNLAKIFYKFIDSYKELWITDPKQIMEQLIMIAVSRSNNKYIDINNYFSQIKRRGYEYTDPRWQQYLPQNFNTQNISEDFSGAYEIVTWMVEKVYNERNIKQIAEKKTTYIFNWGYLPEGVKDGIIPTEQIKQRIKNKKERKTQKIENVKAYVHILEPS